MSSRHDVDRSISAWLTDQVPERASERLLEASRAQIRITRQRQAWWPAWRTSDMNTFAKLAIAAATVLVIAFVGINLLPGSGGSVGGPAAPASPTTTPTATPLPSPADVFPQGALSAGRHPADVAGVAFSFDVPATGWQVMDAGMSVIERTAASGERGWIAFWRPDNVYTWACASQALAPAAGPSVSDLADAMQGIQGTTGATASEATVAGRPAMLVELSVLNALDCEQTSLWYADRPDGATLRRPVSPPGAVVRSWIVDVDGVRFVVDTEQQGSDPGMQAEIQQIVDSIQFE